MPQWAIDKQTKKFPGVVKTSVGYTGGSNPDPTYQSVCDGDGHTEALRIEYDENLTTYEDLLGFYWKQYHGSVPGPQYKSAIWVHDAEQRVAAEKSIEDAADILKKKRIRKAYVDILDASQWHDAEEYHQKYMRKSFPNAK
eukprot:TRINITY_DN16760_c0_g2_i2.p1 TRINITY_DN16760_c0_g2~~TRINITY_DN16760_c0_g2_i2.p1  ORF type:complete len:141 (-),score=39.10 TRINITY_DN16760_c0_g2_i2:372-794(-)